MCGILHSDNALRDLRLVDPNRISTSWIYVIILSWSYVFANYFHILWSIFRHPKCLLFEHQRKPNDMDIGLNFSVSGSDPAVSLNRIKDNSPFNRTWYKPLERDERLLHIYKCNVYKNTMLDWLIDWFIYLCWTPRSTIFQQYHNDQF